MSNKDYINLFTNNLMGGSPSTLKILFYFLGYDQLNVFHSGYDQLHKFHHMGLHIIAP